MTRCLVALTLLISSPALAADTVEFRATINNAGAIAPDGTISTETRMTGVGLFTLTVPATGSPTLAYDLIFEGVDFAGADADPTNDVTAIHFHDTTGVNHSAATPHVLNLFGFPSQDDAQAVTDDAASRVTGVWDDGDLTDPSLGHAGNPMANSDTLTSMLPALYAGELFVMLHTSSPNALPLTPGITIGGQIVPEPSSALLVLGIAAAWCGGRRRTHRS